MHIATMETISMESEIMTILIHGDVETTIGTRYHYYTSTHSDVEPLCNQISLLYKYTW